MSIKQAIEAQTAVVGQVCNAMIRAFNLGHEYGYPESDEAHSLEAHAAFVALLDKTRAAIAALRSMPQGEPVAWQFRWTNPGDNINAHPDELAWKALEPRGSETMAERMAEIAHYTYDGKPCYEVRALCVLATPHTEAVRMSEAWQPIETAPKDGSYMLLYWSTEVVLGHWWLNGGVLSNFGAKGNWTKLGYGAGSTATWSAPTHWQPLPPPPVEQATAARLGVKWGDA